MAIRFLSVVVLIVFFAPTGSAQQFFKWKDKKGKWHFSDTPPRRVTAEKVRGLDISPKSSPATSPYNKPSVSSLAESENKEQAVSKPPAKRPPDVPPGMLTSRWLLIVAPQTEVGADDSKPLSEWRPWQSFDNSEACERERATYLTDPFGVSAGARAYAYVNWSRCISLIEFKPSKEANVTITVARVGPVQRGRIRPALNGRVFNRGLTTARNVVVKYQALNDQGVTVVKGEIRTIPHDIPGLTFAEIHGEIRGGAGVNRLRVFTEVYWSKK